jgi:hypothetical protein
MYKTTFHEYDMAYAIEANNGDIVNVDIFDSRVLAKMGFDDQAHLNRLPEESKFKWSY